MHEKMIQSVYNHVEQFHTKNPVKAHGFDHVKRVWNWTKRILEEEDVHSAHLCELAALLHDIGRIPEHYGTPEERKMSHHELSYIYLKKWNHETDLFEALTNLEMRELLYAVRYHYNDHADDYETAWILRDADKLDMFGEVGLKRSLEFYENDPKGLRNDVFKHHYVSQNFRTKTAQRIFESEKLFKPYLDYFSDQLKAEIEDISV